MPLETATYTSDLNPSNPAASDPLSNADDHMRLIKATIKNTFPNITGQITATQAQINALATGVSSYATGGFYAGTTSGLLVTTSAPTDLTMVAGGQLAATFHQDLSTDFRGPVRVQGSLTINGAGNALNAAGIVPIGGMIMWLSDDLPTWGSWCWANGGTLSRTGNGALLYAEWSRNSGNPLRYGAGDGSTTFNVIDMTEVVPVGKSSMGGAGSSGRLNSIASGVKTVLGSAMGSDTNTISVAQLPPHGHTATSTDAGHTHSIQLYANNGVAGGSTFVAYNAVARDSFGTSSPYTVTSSSGSASITTTVNNTGSGAAVNNVQPSRVCNFIIRIG